MVTGGVGGAGGVRPWIKVTSVVPAGVNRGPGVKRRSRSRLDETSDYDVIV